MHMVNIDNYTLDVIKWLEVSAESTIPYTSINSPINSERGTQTQVGKSRLNHTRTRPSSGTRSSSQQTSPGRGSMRHNRNPIRYAKRKWFRAVE